MKRPRRKRTSAIELRGALKPTSVAAFKAGHGLVGKVHRFHEQQVERLRARGLSVRKAKRAATDATMRKFALPRRTAQNYVREQKKRLQIKRGMDTYHVRGAVETPVTPDCGFKDGIRRSPRQTSVPNNAIAASPRKAPTSLSVVCFR